MSIWRTTRVQDGRHEQTTIGLDPMLLLLLLGLSLAVGAAYLLVWIGADDSVDRCLDRGGCWVYGADVCEMADQKRCDESLDSRP